jgi:hypothetical protein
MLLAELIKRLNKSEENRCSVNLVRLAKELGVHDFNSSISASELKLSAYYFAESIMHVGSMGSAAIFFNKKLVAIESMDPMLSLAKNKPYRWLSQSAFLKIHEYLVSINQSVIEKSKTIDIIDFGQEMNEGYVVPYSDYLLTSDVIYLPTNEKVTVTKHHHDHQNYDLRSIVTIKLADGTEKTANLKTEILVPYELLD